MTFKLSNETRRQEETYEDRAKEEQKNLSGSVTLTETFKSEKDLSLLKLNGQRRKLNPK